MMAAKELHAPGYFDKSLLYLLLYNRSTVLPLAVILKAAVDVTFNVCFKTTTFETNRVDNYAVQALRNIVFFPTSDQHVNLRRRLNYSTYSSKQPLLFRAFIESIHDEIGL